MKLFDAFQDYFRFIQHEQGVTQATLETYKSWLRHFYRWLEANGYPEPTLDAFSTTTLRRFLYDISGRGYRPRTIRGIFHPLRRFGAFLMAQGVLTENPVSALTMPKKDAAQRLTVSDEEIRQLLDACERQHNPRQVALSRAVLAVFVYAGLRRTELCDLKVGDVDLREKSITVRSGKGRKSRRVFLCADAVDALSAWLTVREKDCQVDYLFMFDRKRRIHEVGLKNMLEQIKAIAGLAGKENIKPHSLRHACATRLLRAGANLRDIQAFLGHSSLQITSIYLHSDEHQLRNIAHLSALQSPAPETKKAEVVRLPFAERARSRRMARQA